jgi:hypothetical protein
VSGSSQISRTDGSWRKSISAVSQVVACALMLALDSGSALWIPVVISLICGLPQGLNSLANQNALYFQADADRMGASAGLLRTFSYLGAMVSSAATGAFFKHGADTTGLHDLAAFLIVVAGLLLVLILADPSLRHLGAPTPKGIAATG